MANRDRITNPSNLAKNQANDLLRDISDQINDKTIQTEPDLLNKLFSGFKNIFSRLGKPSMQKRYAPPLSPPHSDDYNKTIKEIKNDLDNIFDESYNLGEAVRKNFNHTIVERDKLRNRIKEIGQLVSDYVVTSKSQGATRNNIVVQDTFVNMNKVDESMVHGTKARVSTSDGVVTLAITGSKDLAPTAEIIRGPDGNIPGNGLPGNYGIAIRTSGSGSQRDAINNMHDGSQEKKNAEYSLMWTVDEHSDANAMLDGKPDTWFEYGSVSVPEGAKKSPPEGNYPDTKGYGWKFSDGDDIYYDPIDEQTGRKVLKMTLHIKLPQPTHLNWIGLDPYIPPGSNQYFTVTDITTSEDDSQYTSISRHTTLPLVIGSDTSATPFEYSDVIDKYTGRGVWSFPSRRAQYIKIYIESEQPYLLNTDTTGYAAHLFWTHSWTETETTKYLIFIKGKTTVTHKTKRIPGEDIDKEAIINSHKADIDTGSVILDVIGSFFLAIGKLFVNKRTEISNEKIEPGLDIYDDGSRWCIGIRNISLNSFSYADKSTLISQRFSLPKSIDTVSLNVSEMVPEEFYRNDEATRNEWIKYYISVDDGATWHRISPLEHQPVGPDVPFPPKVAAVNSKTPQGAQQPNRLYINHEGEARHIRLKVELSRPKDAPDTMTPYLTRYQLNIVPREEDL